MDAPGAESLSVNSLKVTGSIRGGKVILTAWLGTCRHTNSNTDAHCSVRLLSTFTPGAMNNLEGERETLRVIEGFLK